MVGASQYDSSDTHLSYANPHAPKGGTLKQSAIGSFDTLNPYTIKGRAALGLDLVTDRLMARVWDEPFTLVPLIAQGVEVADDRSAITFQLNPAARFHDGTPITAGDVLFSFETLKTHGRPNMRRIYALAQRAEALDDRSVKFTFGPGYDRETAMIFAIMPILSKAWWAGRDFNAGLLEPPMGSGPYKVSSIDPGRSVAYERVADYWARDLLPNRGLHNFDRIVYDYYRDDTAAFEAFKAGDLSIRREWDSALWRGGYDFPAARDGRVVRESIPHGRPDRVRAFIFNTRRAPFDDIRVREALSLLFDFEWVNRSLYHGEYKRIASYFPNTELAATDSPQPPSNASPAQKRDNMKRADALLKDAGWIVRNGTRVNEKTGKALAFDILVDDPGQEKIALAFVRDAERIGVKPRVRVLDTSNFRGRINDYDFDMILYFWLSTLSPGTEQYLYWSCEAAKSPARWNYAGICDPAIDSLSRSIAESETRSALVEKVRALDRALIAGQYMIPLYYNPSDFVAYWAAIQRPDVTPLYGLVMETWWMKE